jgi:DNA polymerase III subunit delta
MKLALYQLESHLGLSSAESSRAKNLALIYIISGDEWVLKQDAILLIRKAAKKNGILERVRLTPEAQAESLYTALHSNSLLAEKRLLELDFRTQGPHKIASDILHEYAKKPSKDQIVLLDMAKLDAKTTKTSWFTALENAGIYISIWPISRAELPKWIRERAQKYKVKMNQDAANLLADYTEGNLASTLSALEKIYLLQPQNSVDRDLISTVMTDESRFTIFDLAENLIAFNMERSLHILENLRQEGVEPTLILWGILRELRLLTTFGQQLKQGMTYDELLKKHHIFSRREPFIRHFLATLSAENCRQFFKDALEIDKAIKGVSAFNVWNSLQLFCLRITSYGEK